MTYEAALKSQPRRLQQLVAILDRHAECQCGHGEHLPYNVCAKCNTELFAFVQTHRLTCFDVEEAMLLIWMLEPLARSTAQ